MQTARLPKFFAEAVFVFGSHGKEVDFEKIF
jgi:hypothetical protein